MIELAAFNLGFVCATIMGARLVAVSLLPVRLGAGLPGAVFFTLLAAFVSHSLLPVEGGIANKL